ncbi:class I SAM-dependent methyltransferase [Fulvivirga kasyanovii]|uniref:Class I SAM-dependent methyltransferase n=1 Tax=Fulvivirga kasyanovii TaxID=396812 RepID=A0ABW9RUV9_9BACT|nr:class I SAM-dependent methyltransferase [Fulvivirga kasyanovii]MTI27977.1 class I SAM-dependent methyltransferase [Fulvivirga kasyanovii]
MSVKYDSIGINYNCTRKADPYLLQRIYAHLNPETDKLYLDIGCGTGNYTTALQRMGVHMIGIDPSETMLENARAAGMEVQWKIGMAENTGLESDSIDGIVATLTIHHWPDLASGFSELSRVIRDGGRIVIFTSTPEQMEGYWLNYYFPVMLKQSMAQMPALHKVTAAMESAGFAVLELEKYNVEPDLQDFFLYSGKHKPDLYLNPDIRRGISSFSSLANALEVEAGLKALKEDMLSGKVEEVIQSYQNDSGDYLFIVGNKQRV